MNEAVTAGVFGLIGSFIGAGAVGWVAWYQIRSERLQNKDQRLFEARREAFEAGIRLFHFITTKRWDGEVINPSNPEAEKYAGYDAMGRLGLHSSDNLREKIVEFTKLISGPIPTDKHLKKLDKEAILNLRNVIIDIMRSELGVTS